MPSMDSDSEKDSLHRFLNLDHLTLIPEDAHHAVLEQQRSSATACTVLDCKIVDKQQ